MAGLGPAIYVFADMARKSWMPESSPGMTGYFAPVEPLISAS
jgi:hypothetical protein